MATYKKTIDTIADTWKGGISIDTSEINALASNECIVGHDDSTARIGNFSYFIYMYIDENFDKSKANTFDLNFYISDTFIKDNLPISEKGLSTHEGFNAYIFVYFKNGIFEEIFIPKERYKNALETIGNHLAEKMKFTISLDYPEKTSSGYSKSDLQELDGVPFLDVPIPVASPKIHINGRIVKSMSSEGKEYESITIDGHTYSFTKNTVVTQDEVKSFVKANTTWATTATIDTTAQLKGLDVTYSKSTGIAEGEKITATVKAPTDGNELNGGITDFVVTDIEMVNPSRTVAQADVESYVLSNVTWSGSPLAAHIDFTKWDMAGTKLSSPDTTWAEGDHKFTVTALPGYSVNGGASADFTVSLISKPKWADDWYASGGSSLQTIYKNLKRYKSVSDIRSLTLDSEGNIWASGFGDGIIYKNGEEVTFADSNPTYSIAVTKQGDIFVGGEFAIYKNNVKITENRQTDIILADEEGNAYYGQGTDLIKIDANTNAVTFTGLTAYQFAISKEGDVYHTKFDYGVYKNDVLLFKLPETAHIEKMVITKENDIYTINQNHEVYKNQTLVMKVPITSSAKDFSVSYDGTIYVATENHVSKNDVVTGVIDSFYLRYCVVSYSFGAKGGQW